MSFMMDSSVCYKTSWGKMIVGDCVEVLKKYSSLDNYQKAKLIFTSPPFPLNRAKKYGNMTGEEYIKWFSNLAPEFKKILADDGSIVIEIGNAWEKGDPVMSTLPIEALMAFKTKGNLTLCQEFIHYNPAALPSPVEWVNKRRIRVKDSFTRIWWMSASPYPYSDNREVLTQYSEKMKKLLERKQYNHGKRPSEHVIGKDSFNVDNGGAIASNVIIASNTSSRGSYFEYCRNNDLGLHPARMSRDIPDFFVRFLTKKGDLVIDPFAGSNTTGAVAEALERNWLSIEINREYAEGSKGRFEIDDC